MTPEKKPQASVTLADITVDNAGSIILFTAHTQAGRRWINLHVPSDAQFFAGALCVEHRYALDLTKGMITDGLIVRVA